MGTRNLTMVRKDGKLKVAQYGQWDGHPSGQGETATKFIIDNLQNKEGLDKFKMLIDKVEYYSEAELKKLNKDIEDKKIEWDVFVKENPEFTRDTGAEILQHIFDGTVTKTKNDEEFLKDGLFCEYAYCLDLDKEELEVYDSGELYKSIKFASLNSKSMDKLEKEMNDEEE